MDETRYEYVDVNALSTVLAESDWEQQTKGVIETDLYEVTALLDPDRPTATMVKTVKDYWQTTFFALRDGYLQLLLNYSRHDNQTECSTDRPEGTNQ